MERIIPEFDLELEEGRQRCSAGEFCDRLRRFLRRESRSFPEGGALLPADSLGGTVEAVG